MASTQPLIRHARREDVPAILDLIKELADYEKELSSVEATEAKLLSTLAFAPSTPATANPSTPTNEHGDDDGGPTSGQLPVTDPITPTAPARCLLLFPNPTAAATDKPVGMALYFYNYSTWRAKAGIYLEDLYVTPAERNKGHGKRLLVALAKEVVAMDGGRLDWSVLKWNEPSIRFYEDVVGATRMEEWVGMRVDREALGKLATMLD